MSTQNIFAPRPANGPVPAQTDEVNLTPEEVEEDVQESPDVVNAEPKPIAPQSAEQVKTKRKATRNGTKQQVLELEEELEAITAKVALERKANQAISNQLLVLTSQVKILQDTIIIMSKK